jgi:hypothetical protein
MSAKEVDMTNLEVEAILEVVILLELKASPIHTEEEEAKEVEETEVAPEAEANTEEAIEVEVANTLQEMIVEKKSVMIQRKKTPATRSLRKSIDSWIGHIMSIRMRSKASVR